jgi:hypothetical protein
VHARLPSLGGGGGVVQWNFINIELPGPRQAILSSV